MKKALITLCTVAATMVAGISYAESGAGGAQGERGYRDGLYNNTPRLNTADPNQSAMTPYNNMNNNDSYTYSAAQQKLDEQQQQQSLSVQPDNNNVQANPAMDNSTQSQPNDSMTAPVPAADSATQPGDATSNGGWR